MGAYEEKWQLQYKCIRTAFNPKYIAPDLNIVHRSSRGEAKLPINTIAAHFLAFSRAAVQSWHLRSIWRCWSRKEKCWQIDPQTSKIPLGSNQPPTDKRADEKHCFFSHLQRLACPRGAKNQQAPRDWPSLLFTSITSKWPRNIYSLYPRSTQWGPLIYIVHLNSTSFAKD